MRIKSIILPVLTLVLAILIACAAGPQPQAQDAATQAETPRDGVFIHISHGPEDAHRVLMALKMAEMMASDKDVLVYFDIEGIKAVLNDAPDIEYAQFPKSHEQIAKLAAMGVPVFACPGCLAAAGKTADDLRAGVVAAEKEAFFNFTKGRILTLDY